ncbi:MAG: hypothetical protein JNL62_17110, partial [Bryobacterales bacterium]|nr:hypothetical protein [Bryobacterales bacterium]
MAAQVMNMPIFEITPDDIAVLNDEQLRTLVGRLCEAELRRRGQSPVYVTYGGHQDAADGGIDVRVDLPQGSAIDGFIPRPNTCYQAKRQDMPPAKILEELRPKGILRPAIQELAGQSGAYIIVSSKGSTTSRTLKNRRDAMLKAVAGGPSGQSLVVDFYDRNRLATWVRSHEALIPWVRELVGKPIPGWQSYGPWAAPVTEEYLKDDQLRLHPGKKTTETGLSAQQGIEAIRNELLHPRQVVRLVG